GKTVASGSHDNTIKLWDVASGRERAQLRHTGAVRSLAFSHDGKVLASGSNDMTVKLWDVATGVELATLRGHDHGVRGVAFSPDGKTLATATMDALAKLWDVAEVLKAGIQSPAETSKDDELDSFAGHTAYVTAVAFSPDDKILASGSHDRTARLWDVASG